MNSEPNVKLTRKQQATKDFLLSLKDRMNSENTVKTITLLIEDTIKAINKISDQDTSTPEQRKQIEEMENNVYESFTNNPHVISFITKMADVCKDEFNNYKKEIIKSLNSDIRNTKKNLATQTSPDDQEFNQKMLNNQMDQKTMYQTEPQQYTNLTGHQHYHVFKLVSKMIQFLSRQ